MAKERFNTKLEQVSQTAAPAAASAPLDTHEHFLQSAAVTRLGSDVVFYEQGDPKQEPLLAKVTRVTPTGLLLHVFTLRGMQVREFVRHINDPWFQEGTREKVLREKGAWDTLAAAQERLDQQAEARRQAVLKQQQAQEAGRQSIIDAEPLMTDVAMAAEQMARDGLTIPEMVTKLGGKATLGQLQHHFATHTVSA